MESFINNYTKLITEYDALVSAYPLLEYHLTFIKCHIIRHAKRVNGTYSVDRDSLIGISDRQLKTRFDNAESHFFIAQACVDNHLVGKRWGKCDHCEIFQIGEPKDVKEYRSFRKTMEAAAYKLFMQQLKK